MPYLVHVIVYEPFALPGAESWQPAQYHVEVNPGSWLYESNQVQAAIERRLPGRTFVINSVVEDFGYESGEDVEIALEVA